MKSRTGVSEIVASMMVLAIVSVLGVMLYNISIGTMNGRQDDFLSNISTTKKISQQRFEIISVAKISDKIKIYFHNYGLVDIKITDIYLSNANMIVHPDFSPSQYLIDHNGELGTSEISFIIVDYQEGITFYKIVSEEGVSSEISIIL